MRPSLWYSRTCTGAPVGAAHEAVKAGEGGAAGEAAADEGAADEGAAEERAPDCAVDPAVVAAIAGPEAVVPDIGSYDDTTYRVRLSTLVLGFVGVEGYDRQARSMAAQACIEAAYTR